MFPELRRTTLYRLYTYHDNGESHTFISTKIMFNINKHTFQKQNWKKKKKQGFDNCSSSTEQYILFSYSILSITGCQLQAAQKNKSERQTEAKEMTQQQKEKSSKLGSASEALRHTATER